MLIWTGRDSQRPLHRDPLHDQREVAVAVEEGEQAGRDAVQDDGAVGVADDGLEERRAVDEFDVAFPADKIVTAKVVPLLVILQLPVPSGECHDEAASRGDMLDGSCCCLVRCNPATLHLCQCNVVW